MTHPTIGSPTPQTASQIASQLSARKYQILLAVVECYLEDGEPVSSAAVAQKRLGPQPPSPATIRNTMGELSEMGLLTQPHTSAGRLPTATAIQIFVDSLSAIRIQARDVNRLEQQLSSLDSLELRIEEGSHVLTELTQNVGITAALPPAAQILQQVELVHLSERQYLMVVVTADRLVRNHLVTLSQRINPGELTEIRNYINFHFSGWTLSKARRELASRLQEERGQVDELLRKVELFYAKGLLHLGFTPEIYVDGASYLVGLDLHLTRERMRQLFQALDQKQQIMSILDQFLEGTADQPSVKVGLEAAHPAMGEISLVGMQVPLSGGMSARVAVMGPLRLNYPRMISAVMQVGKALTQSAEQGNHSNLDENSNRKQSQAEDHDHSTKFRNSEMQFNDSNSAERSFFTSAPSLSNRLPSTYPPEGNELPVGDNKRNDLLNDMSKNMSNNAAEE